MARLIIAPLATVDLDEIWLYIARDNPNAADRFIRELKVECATLAEYAHIGRPRDDLGRGLRSSPYGAYVIIYREVEGGAQITRIVHGRRDLRNVVYDE